MARARRFAHVGWELYSFEAALGLGFLLAAWQPQRYVPALLPLAAAVAALTMVPSAVNAAAATAAPLEEASHLSVLFGLAGLLLLSLRARGPSGGLQRA